jgi:hypothetical protein
MVAPSPPPDAAMKRFVLAGLFLVLGFIILGVATSYVMSGPDKPTKPHPAAANADETSRRQRNPGTAQQVNTQPLQSQNQPGQFGMSGGMGGSTAGSMGDASGRNTGAMGNLTQVPGTIVPLTTTVPPPSVRPHPNTADTPRVPVLPQTDESSSSGRGHN